GGGRGDASDGSGGREHGRSRTDGAHRSRCREGAGTGRARRAAVGTGRGAGTGRPDSGGQSMVRSWTPAEDGGGLDEAEHSFRTPSPDPVPRGHRVGSWTTPMTQPLSRARARTPRRRSVAPSLSPTP